MQINNLKIQFMKIIIILTFIESQEIQIYLAYQAKTFSLENPLISKEDIIKIYNRSKNLKINIIWN